MSWLAFNFSGGIACFAHYGRKACAIDWSECAVHSYFMYIADLFSANMEAQGRGAAV